MSNKVLSSKLMEMSPHEHERALALVKKTSKDLETHGVPFEHARRLALQLVETGYGIGGFDQADKLCWACLFILENHNNVCQKPASSTRSNFPYPPKEPPTSAVPRARKATSKRSVIIAPPVPSRSKKQKFRHSSKNPKKTRRR